MIECEQHYHAISLVQQGLLHLLPGFSAILLCLEAVAGCPPGGMDPPSKRGNVGEVSRTVERVPRYSEVYIEHVQHDHLKLPHSSSIAKKI